jgi:hypothetical protein
MIPFALTVQGDMLEGLDRYADKIQKQLLYSGSVGMGIVIRDAAKAAVHPTVKGHWFHGTQFKVSGVKYWYDPGSLRNAIYVAYSPERSNEQQVTYKVSWNHTAKAPKGVAYGFMVEYGTRGKAAHSFMRPALDSMPKAIEAGKAAMRARLGTLL